MTEPLVRTVRPGPAGVGLEELAGRVWCFPPRLYRWELDAVRALADREPVVRATLQHADRTFRRSFDWSLEAVLADADAPGERLAEEHREPLNTAVQLAQVELWRARGLHPEAVLGICGGEAAAAYAAGALDLDETLCVAAAWGRMFRDRLPPVGAMCTASLGHDAAQQLLRECDPTQRVQVALVWSDHRCILSGPTEGVHAVAAALASRGIETRPLPTAFALHTAFGAGERERFLELFAGLTGSVGTVVRYSAARIDGLVATPPDATWWHEVTAGPVRLDVALALLRAHGATRLLDVGVTRAPSVVAAGVSAGDGTPPPVPSLAYLLGEVPGAGNGSAASGGRSVVAAASTVLPTLEARGVAKKFCRDLRRSLWYGLVDIARELGVQRTPGHVLRPQEFWAVEDVSLEVRPGEAVALIGSNGAGKSTLLKLLTGLVKPDAGEITVRGRVGALIELGAGFNPVLSGRENIHVNAAILGLRREEIEPLIEPMIEFAELGEFIDAPLQDYSSGMWVRLAYAIAAFTRPDILLADEILAVGDLRFQRKCLQHMQRYLADGGTLVLVTHNLYLVQSMCTRGIVLDRGRVAYAGSAVDAVRHYLDGRSRDGADTGASPARRAAARAPVRLVRVALEPEEGSTLRSEAPARVVVDYESDTTHAGVNWGFSLWTADLAVCVVGALREDGAASVSAGRGRFTARIPRLSLAEGTFALRAAVLEAETGAPIALSGYQDPPTYVRVELPSQTLGNLFAIAAALTTTSVEWS